MAEAQGQGPRRPGASEPIPSIEDRTSGFKRIDGFFPLYWDDAGGRLFLEVPKLDTEVLYSTGLATGLGSNDIAACLADILKLCQREFPGNKFVCGS